MTATRNKGRQFVKGVSGNPAGRPPGKGEAAKLREELLEHWPTAKTKLLALIRKGNVNALRIYFDRVSPTLRQDSVDMRVGATEGALDEMERATRLSALLAKAVKRQAAKEGKK